MWINVCDSESTSPPLADRKVKRISELASSLGGKGFSDLNADEVENFLSELNEGQTSEEQEGLASSPIEKDKMTKQNNKRMDIRKIWRNLSIGSKTEGQNHRV